MSITKHTPGKWYVGVHSLTVLGSVWPRNRRSNIIATAKTPEDALLIAAAPDLLAALEGLEDIIMCQQHDMPGPDDVATRWDAARAAIAKATKR